ncbi:hypothetical protein PRN20_07605 [Devosia sp. ZB163]|nr:hypothetical protein [Devosia sp. ZB163]MDC9823592.1 hypothetical protein [Devosia sp. ZB163]
MYQELRELDRAPEPFSRYTTVDAVLEVETGLSWQGVATPFFVVARPA